MRAKSIVLLMLALGCGLVASIGITQVIQRDKSPEPVGDTKPIYVASQDISQGDLLTAQVVQLEDWPRDKVFEDCMSKIEDIEGCRARTDILVGEQIREKKLLGKNVTQQTPADNIPKGYRVVGVKVDLVSGAGLIRPGDRVDVLVHFKPSAKDGIHETSTRTILQDIKVFAVNDTFKLDPAGDEEDSITAKTISLLVNPEQGEKLMLASQLGKVQLVMRSPGDKELASTGGAKPEDLFGTADSSNRQDENQSELHNPKSGSGLFEFLKGIGSKPAPKEGKPPLAIAQPPQLPQISTFGVRLLEGPNVSTLTLEQTPDGSTWTVGSPESGTWLPKTGQATPPGPTPEQPPEPQDQPGDGDGDGDQDGLGEEKEQESD